MGEKYIYLSKESKNPIARLKIPVFYKSIKKMDLWKSDCNYERVELVHFKIIGTKEKGSVYIIKNLTTNEIGWVHSDMVSENYSLAELDYERYTRTMDALGKIAKAGEGVNFFNVKMRQKYMARISQDFRSKASIIANWYFDEEEAYKGIVKLARDSMNHELKWSGKESNRYITERKRYKNTLAYYKKWERERNGKEN